MNKTTEALKMAIEALESCEPADTSTGHVIWPSYDEKAVAKAINACKEALSQEQEPVAWRNPNDDDRRHAFMWHGKPRDKSKYTIPLYTHPAPSQEQEPKYVDRGEATNLARNVMTGVTHQSKVTARGVWMLCEAIMKMDLALSLYEQSDDLLTIAYMDGMHKGQKIGCVQHDCQQCKNRNIQEPVSFDEYWRDNAQPWHDYDTAREFWAEAQKNHSEHNLDMVSQEQEPVAWMYEVNHTYIYFDAEKPPEDAYDEGTLVPLYTHPAQPCKDCKNDKST